MEKKQMNEDNQWVKDIQQISKRYDTARKKKHLNKATNKNKLIYFNNKTYIDT